MILWTICIAVTGLGATVVLWRHFGVRGKPWAWIEVIWSVLSLVALGLGLIQLNDKLDDIRSKQVNGDLITMATAFRAGTVTRLGLLEDREAAQKVEKSYSINVPKLADLRYERRLVTYEGPNTLIALKFTEEASNQLCEGAFGNKWRAEIGDRYNKLPKENMMSSEDFMYEQLVVHCYEAIKITEAANEEDELQRAKEARTRVYSIGWLWVYALGIGLVLKFLKAVSDLIAERQATPR